MTHKDPPSGRLFSTRLGVLATTVGSSVGLGNIWRFPYEAGTHGGGAFLFCYLIFTFLIGIPVVCSEFVMGRYTRSDVSGAYRKLATRGKWWIMGYLGILGAVLIIGFYTVVAGWTLEYLTKSLTGELTASATSADLHVRFGSFITSTWQPILWIIVFMGLNYFILIKGAAGIEKVSNVLMPLLFLILIVFCINSLMLPKTSEGLQFLFTPDFSAVTPRMLLSALGQSFFSLSLGIGCMTTYASYFSDKIHLGRDAAIMAILDTTVATLAGIIIFPAVFTYGFSPTAGPTLVFEVFPEIFVNFAGGAVWSTLFFALLAIASLTSTISMHEIVIKFLTDKLGMHRRSATLLDIGVTTMLAVLCALSFGKLQNITVAGLTFFNLFDYLASNIIMPLGGMICSIFVGWVVERKVVNDQLTNHGTLRAGFSKFIVFSLRYIAPLAIFVIFLNSLGVI